MKQLMQTIRTTVCGVACFGIISSAWSMHQQLVLPGMVTVEDSECFSDSSRESSPATSPRLPHAISQVDSHNNLDGSFVNLSESMLREQILVPSPTHVSVSSAVLSESKRRTLTPAEIHKQSQFVDALKKSMLQHVVAQPGDGYQQFLETLATCMMDASAAYEVKIRSLGLWYFVPAFIKQTVIMTADFDVRSSVQTFVQENNGGYGAVAATLLLLNENSAEVAACAVNTFVVQPKFIDTVLAHRHAKIGLAACAAVVIAVPAIYFGQRAAQSSRKIDVQ